MSDFPHACSADATRKWLDDKGFENCFKDWEADALIGADKEDVLTEFPDNPNKGKQLWGLLNTARASVSSSGGAKKEFSVKIFYGKSSRAFKFTSYEILLEEIETEWKSLKEFKYDIILNPTKGPVVETDVIFHDVRQLKSKHDKLVVRRYSKGFSKYDNEKEVFQYIDAIFGSSDFIPTYNGDPDFPLISSSIISDEDLDTASNYVLKDLKLRSDVIKITHATEYSMREFISPILIHAVKLMSDHLKKQKIVEQLSLSCEKKIIGNVFFGPVDYSVVFDCLDIVLTEAKRGSSELKAGILQNLLQQRSSKEFLAKAATDPGMKGKKRMIQVDENFKNLKPLTTCGIVSDGKDWVFTKTIFEENAQKSKVIQSATYNILPKIDLIDVKDLISRILGVIHVQLNDTKSNEIYQRFKRNKIDTEAVLNREVTLAKDTMENLEHDDMMESQEGEEQEESMLDEES